MGLLEELTPEKLRNKFVHQCGMCRVLGNLSDIERVKVEELLNNEFVSKAKLAKLLTEHGYEVKVQVVTRHARGECAG